MNWSHHSCDMGQRNMLSKLQMHDLNSDLVELQFLPAPNSVVNSVTGPIAGIHPSLSSSGPFSPFDITTYPDNRENNMVHGNLFNDFHSPNLRLELDGPPDAGFHTHQYLAPPFAHGHGSSSSDVLPSNINRVVELNLNEDPRMGQYVDNERRPSKRKFAEGSGSGHCYVNKFAGSGSSTSVTGPSAPVLDALIERGKSLIEKAPSPGLPDMRVSGSLSTIEDGSHRSTTCSSQAVSVDLRLAHHFAPEHQGSYVAQSSQPAGIIWPEQYNNNVDVGNASWMCAHPLSLSTPGMLAVCGDGLEATSMNGHGYMGAASNMNTGYSNPAPVPYPYEYYSPVQSIPGNGYGMGYPPPIAHAFHHPPVNLQYGSANPSHGFIESVSVHPITASLSTDVRHSQVISQAPQVIITNPTVSHPPSVDYNSEDDGSSDDEHRDLRMDIDGMSYEELLALEEQIGDVSTGLSEETIAKCMTKRLPTHFNFLSAIDSGRTEKFDETCTICQVQLEEKEMIGALNCGHEYHAECIRKWLLVKNFCPVCKNPADSSPVKTE